MVGGEKIMLSLRLDYRVDNLGVGLGWFFVEKLFLLTDNDESDDSKT